MRLSPTRLHSPRQPRKRPDLHFGNSTDRTGFTPAGIAAFSDLRPAAVVRELVQNSLDAAIEAGERRAHVRFSRTACAIHDIPGIESYRRAFELAREQQKPAGSARAVVQRIARTLRDDSHDVLCVTDNGSGLDGVRMSALLSDGVSAKGGTAAGSYGNGHSVVVPASNLRYVLYGGLTESGECLGAGQAVLASHCLEGEFLSQSGRGVFVSELKPSEPGVAFTFARDSAIPPMVAEAIDRIRYEHGHGAAVVVPAFNNFEADLLLRDMVFKAAACSFFRAIHDKELIVEVEDPDGGGRLDSNTLRGEIEKHRDELRIRGSGAFLSGNRANEAYAALDRGTQHQIRTAQGDVAVHLLVDGGLRGHGVGLCRNGMWITDRLPMFSNHFTDRQPFQALIVLGSASDSPFYQLVRDAETPLHDKLAPTMMEPAPRKALRDAFREIRDGIAELVPEASADVYSPDDILSFQFSDIEGGGRGGRQPSYRGRIESSRRRLTDTRKGAKGEPGGPNLGGGKGTRKPPKGRIVVQPAFRIVSVPSAPRRRKIEVHCTEPFEDAELRIFVDENVDATCDRQTRAQATPVLLNNVAINGRPSAESDLVSNGDAITGIKLGSLAGESSLVVETDWEMPPDSDIWVGDRDPALRIEVLRTQDIVTAEAAQ